MFSKKLRAGKEHALISARVCSVVRRHMMLGRYHETDLNGKLRYRSVVTGSRKRAQQPNSTRKRRPHDDRGCEISMVVIEESPTAGMRCRASLPCLTTTKKSHPVTEALPKRGFHGRAPPL